MIAALSRKKIIAPLTFEGHCDRNLFETWFERCLVPLLEIGQTLILDNISFHKSHKIDRLAKEAGCEILYLPPYSPDLNDIEHEWFPIKNRARKNISRFPSLREAVDAAFLN